MKLILLSSPNFFVEEDKIISTLFEEGLDILHLRKPNSEPVYSERLLTLLPQEYHSKTVVHDHFYLKDEFDLMGIHLNKRNPSAPANYRGLMSRSCYTIEDLADDKKSYQYQFLTPIFDSISNPNHKAQFSPTNLKEAAHKGIIDKHVMALGGISLENIEQVKEYGFGGIVVRGDLWNRFNIHSGQDFRDVIAHFRKLRKAVG